MPVGSICNFKGRFFFLSNFHLCQVYFEGKVYPSVEHAFQAAKSFDKKYREKILSKKYPGQAKNAGQSVRLRSDWELVKDKIMLQLVTRKFQIPQLRKLLLLTEDAELIEGNYWHDNYWGDCFCQNKSGRSPDCLKPGKNQLGKILMKVRKDIKKDVKREIHGQVQG